jgi:hypothetical protein
MAAKMRLPGRKGHSPGELAAGTEQKRIPPLRYGMTTKKQRQEQKQIPCGNDKQKNGQTKERTNKRE